MKIIKKILKIASIFLVSIILLILVILTLAKIFDDEIAAFTVEKLEQEIDAPMSIGKVSINPVFSFPNMSVEINNFLVGEPDKEEIDTLLYIGNLKAGLSTIDLINGIYTLKKVEISGLDFDYLVDGKGKSNIDFILDIFTDTTSIEPENTESAPIDFSAEKFNLVDIKVYYSDSTTNTSAKVYIPEISLKVKSKNDVYSGKSEGGIVVSNCSFEDTNLDKMQSCEVNFDVEYEDDIAEIKNLTVKSEGLDLQLEGEAEIGDTIKAKTTFKANNLDFNILKKYIPEVFDEIYGDISLFTTESLIADINVNYHNDLVDFKSLKINSEGLDIDFDGKILLKDTLEINSKLNSLALDFNTLKKYVPAKYLLEYGINQIGGKTNISADINGKYADSTMLPFVNATVNLNDINLLSADYPEVKSLSGKIDFINGNKIDMSEAAAKFTSVNINLPESNINLSGSFKNLVNPEFALNTDLKILIQDFAMFIPDSLAKNPQGNIVASLKTKGKLPDNIDDKFIDKMLNNSELSVSLNDVSAIVSDTILLNGINTEFAYTPKTDGIKSIELKKLKVKAKELNIDIDNSNLRASLSGNYSDPSSLKINLESMRFQSGNNSISCKGSIKNIENPDYDISSTIILNLKELMPFAPDTLIKNMQGIVKSDISSNGKINMDSIEDEIFAIIFNNSSFDFIFNNISLAFPDSTMNFDNFSSQMSLKNDVLNVNKLKLTYNGLLVQMDSTIVKNIYKTVIQNKKEQLFVDTRIKLGDIIYDDFKHFLEYESTKEETASATENTEAQNWTFLFHGKASVNSVVVDSTIIEGYKINRLHLNDISTLFKLTDSTYIFDQFKFKAFEGEMNNSIHYKIKEDGTESVSTHNIIKGMNIRTLLRDFDNFAMDSLITYQNISGLFSTDLNTFIPIDDSVLIDKICVSGDLTLEDGGVYDYEPAKELSKFTAIKELDNIQFKTLNSNIFMFKNKLYVPRTNIVSNAIDIAAFGMQSMRDENEYHLEIHLSNILFGKGKRRNEKQDKAGEEVDEKTLKKSSRKIRYKTTAGKSKIALDSNESRDNMMNVIRVQKKMLNFIFFPKNIHYNTEINNED